MTAPARPAAPFHALEARYAFNDRTGRYRDRRTGRFVPQATIRRALDQRLDAGARRVRSLSQQLQRREITLVEWQAGMRAAVKDVQLTSAALAKGGWAQMRAEDWGRAGQRVRVSYGYLQRFALQLEQGLPADGRFLTRAMMYAQAGRETHMVVERLEMARRGLTEGRSVLAPADHCDVCVSEARAGWRPSAEITPIGQRTCKSNCRCRIIYRRPEAA